MKVGVALPHYGADASPAVIRDFARAAEDAGLASVWVIERLLRPHPVDQRPGEGLPGFYAVVYDPLDTLIWVAGHTRTITLGTSTLDVLFHSPVHLARRIAGLDQLSGGRLLVTVGQGWMAEEFTATGADPVGPGAQLEEYLDALRALWAPDPVVVDGPRHRVPRSDVGPKPRTPGGPPLLLAVNGPRGVARAARHGDGLHPIAWTWPQITEVVSAYHDLGRRPGPHRPPGPVVVRGNHPVHPTDPRPGPDRPPLAGNPAQLADDFDRLAELGVDHVLLDLTMAGVPLPTQLALLDPLGALGER